MGTIEQNVKMWSTYEWPEAGSEWSFCWGGTDYMWHGTILPRIMAFVPTGTILEIAPGHGRCTQYLVSLCKDITVVDVTKECIETCKKRFENYSHIKYFVNNGKSLDMIEDNSLDFVFSWDSLVHAESDVMSSYLKHLAVKLKPGGFGFLHHSNVGMYKKGLIGKLSVENTHWRAESMSAKLFREYCEDVGLKCLFTEIIGWGGYILNDCFSLFTREETRTSGETIIQENPEFMKEALNLKKVAELYNPLAEKK